MTKPVTPKVFTAWPAGLEAMMTIERTLDGSGLPQRLLELMRLRASQMNGCSFCIWLHEAKARSSGVSEQEIAGLADWRRMESLSSEERAALALTEALTSIDQTVIASAVAEAKTTFTSLQIAQLGYAVAAINSWNRLAMVDKA